jgi:plastocyanin
MGVPWPININPKRSKPPLVVFDPNPLPAPGTSGPIPGDDIFWANNDSTEHWPGLKNPDGSINKTFFMQNPVKPNKTSDTFNPGGPGTFNYVCSIHTNETGTIVVSNE